MLAVAGRQPTLTASAILAHFAFWSEGSKADSCKLTCDADSMLLRAASGVRWHVVCLSSLMIAGMPRGASTAS